MNLEDALRAARGIHGELESHVQRLMRKVKELEASNVELRTEIARLRQRTDGVTSYNTATEAYKVHPGQL